MRKKFAEFIETELKPGTLLITCGLPGSYKTETSEEISRIKGYPILRSDLIRLEVLREEDLFDEKAASDMNKRLSVYDEMFHRAEDLTKKNKEGLILDATFVAQELRRRAAELSEKHNMILVIVQTHCSENTSLTRILKRTRDDYESNALTKEAYYNNKKRFEPVDLNDLKKRYPKLKVKLLKVCTEYDSPENWHIFGLEER